LKNSKVAVTTRKTIHQSSLVSAARIFSSLHFIKSISLFNKRHFFGSSLEQSKIRASFLFSFQFFQSLTFYHLKWSGK